MRPVFRRLCRRAGALLLGMMLTVGSVQAFFPGSGPPGGGGGGGAPGGQGAIPEIHLGSMAAALALLAGSTLLLTDRRRYPQSLA